MSNEDYRGEAVKDLTAPSTKQKLINAVDQLQVMKLELKENQRLLENNRKIMYDLEDLTRELLYQWVREEGIPFPEVVKAADF